MSKLQEIFEKKQKHTLQYILGTPMKSKLQKISEKDVSKDNKLIAELHILRDPNPVYRKLGMMELNNPSTSPQFEVAQRGTRFEDMLITYTAEINKDKIGVDFMTNQPKYKTREVMLEAGKTYNIAPQR